MAGQNSKKIRADLKVRGLQAGTILKLLFDAVDERDIFITHESDHFLVTTRLMHTRHAAMHEGSLR